MVSANGTGTGGFVTSNPRQLHCRSQQTGGLCLGSLAIGSLFAANDNGRVNQSCHHPRQQTMPHSWLLHSVDGEAAHASFPIVMRAVTALNWIQDAASRNWIQSEPTEKAFTHYEQRLSEYARQDSNLQPSVPKTADRST